jgi:hypothetical protein
VCNCGQSPNSRHAFPKPGGGSVQNKSLGRTPPWGNGSSPIVPQGYPSIPFRKASTTPRKEESSFTRLSIFFTAYMTVEWSFPPNR